MIKAFVVVLGLIAVVAAIDCKSAADGYYCNSNITTYTWCAGGSTYSMRCGAGTACQCPTDTNCGTPCTTAAAAPPATTGAKAPSTTGAKAPSTTGATTFCSSAKDGYYCNTGNSSTYTLCSGGSMFVMPCGAGTFCNCTNGKNNACRDNSTSACSASPAPAPATTGAPAAPPKTFCQSVADGYYCNSNTSTYTWCAGGSTYLMPCGAGTSCQCTGANSSCPANTPACTATATPAPSTTGAPAPAPVQCEAGNTTAAMTFCQSKLDAANGSFPDGKQYFCDPQSSNYYQCFQDSYCPSRASPRSALQPCANGTVCAGSAPARCVIRPRGCVFQSQAYPGNYLGFASGSVQAVNSAFNFYVTNNADGSISLSSNVGSGYLGINSQTCTGFDGSGCGSTSIDGGDINVLLLPIGNSTTVVGIQQAANSHIFVRLPPQGSGIANLQYYDPAVPAGWEVFNVSCQ